VALSLIIADYDPGTLTASYVIFLTIALVLLCLVAAGVLLCANDRRSVGRLLMVAGICLVVGICAAICAIWLSHAGFIHLL